MEMGEGIDYHNDSLKSWLCLPSCLIRRQLLFFIILIGFSMATHTDTAFSG